MKALFTKQTLGIILNIGGTALVATGFWLLPIDIAYRLIILGGMSLIMWHTLQ